MERESDGHVPAEPAESDERRTVAGPPAAVRAQLPAHQQVIGMGPGILPTHWPPDDADEAT